MNKNTHFLLKSNVESLILLISHVGQWRINEIRAYFGMTKNWKNKIIVPKRPPCQRCGKVKLFHIVSNGGRGGIGNDVEKKLFLNSILSTIIVKSKMES